MLALAPLSPLKSLSHLYLMESLAPDVHVPLVLHLVACFINNFDVLIYIAWPLATLFDFQP
jgi:hypothetical protein